MKKRILIIVLFIVLVLLVGIYFISGMNISNSKKTEKDITSTTTKKENITTTFTREKLSLFKNKETSYWEKVARDYYISKTNKDGIIVYSEITKDGITIYITLNDKILDVYTAKEDADFKNISNENIELK